MQTAVEIVLFLILWPILVGQSIIAIGLKQCKSFCMSLIEIPNAILSLMKQLKRSVLIPRLKFFGLLHKAAIWATRFILFRNVVNQYRKRYATNAHTCFYSLAPYQMQKSSQMKKAKYSQMLTCCHGAAFTMHPNSGKLLRLNYFRRKTHA